MAKPLVSVVVPCYNGEKYITTLLNSILTQDYENIELIVINDGSTDSTLPILKSYKENFKKQRIKYIIISQDNKGAAGAINAGIKVVSGDYLTFIDCDDYISEDSISKRVSYLEKHKDIDVVWSPAAVVNLETGGVVETIGDIHQPHRRDLFDNMLNHDNYVWSINSRMIRTSVFLETHPDREIYEKSPGQNIQIFLPIYYKGNNVGYIDEVLAFITAHDDSESRRNRDEYETRKYQMGVKDTYINTLKKIDMPSKERQKYIDLVKNRYKIHKRQFSMGTKGVDQMEQLYKYDETKFRQNFSADINSADEKQLISRIIFHTHSLEKGLSNDKFAIGHGLQKTKLLSEMIEIYKRKGYNQSDLAYVNALSALKEFRERHENTKFADEIDESLGDLAAEVKDCHSNIGGSLVILEKDKRNNNKKNFKDLAEGRYAVRSYSDKPVDKNDIKEAVGIAMKTPTVCNRQSLHVRIFDDKDVIHDLLKVQGGIDHYNAPPILLLVTADDRGYVGANERNQGFIDGGLFAMSLLYALEYKSLAACPLHAMFDEVNEKTIRGMTNIADSEKLITFMAVGHFRDVNNVCKSFRYPAEHIISKVDRIYDFEIKVAEKQEIEPEELLQPAESIFGKLRKKLRPRTRLRELRSKLRPRTRIKELTKDANSLIYNKVNKPDGAIVTLSGYFNYGNIIQRYALQKFLDNNGYNFTSYFQGINEVDDVSFGKSRDELRRFVNKKIRTKEPNRFDDYRYYIAGSDQVWRNWGYSGERKELGYYFFNFINNVKAKKIAYAASFGADNIKEANISDDFVQYVKPYVSNLAAIGMREASGVKMVNNLWGAKACQVIDPTLLLTKEDYSKIIDSRQPPDAKFGKVFAYILDDNEINQKIVDELGGLVGSVDKLYPRSIDRLPAMEYWLKGFRDSEFVITDSFHGAVFAIINNTPFIAIENKGGGLTRLVSLLQQFGLQDRLVTSEADLKSTHSELSIINWGRINKKLDKLRKDSGAWLLDQLDRNVIVQPEMFEGDK